MNYQRLALVVCFIGGLALTAYLSDQGQKLRIAEAIKNAPVTPRITAVELNGEPGFSCKRFRIVNEGFGKAVVTLYGMQYPAYYPADRALPIFKLGEPAQIRLRAEGFEYTLEGDSVGFNLTDAPRKVVFTLHVLAVHD